MKLYSYFRSSASYRVRIALNIKGISYEYVPVHLINNGGLQHQETYRKLNPSELVPMLVDGENILTQSVAIIEYLEENYPSPSLLPKDSYQKARIRAFSLDIACELHPLNNLRVLQYLQQQFQINDEVKNSWYRHWVNLNFSHIETKLEGRQDFCFGSNPTMADCFLIPQVFNALRFNVNLDLYPKIQAVYEHCMRLDVFQNAAPERQPDAE
ncbi:maleylacetoacetate isomerase [Rodentibacter myodis]|uniref:Maleylacetoacetate isomerase n=1 Tax=Rodentibacter myodis TaxID=1907939 RepID=A0A1V3JPR0_9PAST|nr:maleylacetoacetate isomerase [Rodentibacter myodis]OOF58774.1 maleylacetoacetate isomerase [Rodentibacter myodis]